MAIQELGGSELLLRFDDDYLGGLHAVQGESGRTFKYILVNPAGAVMDARPYNLTMTVAMKGGINQTTVQGKSDGTFEIEVTVDMLARYGKGDVQLMISEVETKKTLGTVIGTILIERNIAFDSGEGINLIFEFAELQQKIAFMSTLVEQGNENLNQAMVAKIEACNCADESVLARDESVAIKDSLSDVFETEEERKSNEAQRIADEKIRLEKEVTRQSEETERQTAEEQRIADEKTRQSQEITRKSQETARESAEEKRVSSENIRDEEEEIRKSNEVKREENEDSRIDNESKRETAEIEREIKFDSWDKTMQGVIPNATETDTGVVKISALDTEEAPYTTVSIGKLNEEIAKSGLSEEELQQIYNDADNKISTLEAKIKSDVAGLDTRVTQNTNKIGTCWSEIASIDAKLAENSDSISGVESGIQGLETEVKRISDIFLPVSPDDTSNAPGVKRAVNYALPALPKYDDSFAFYGEVPASELISGDDLALMIGLSDGEAKNSSSGWLKFSLGGKILFIAKKHFRTRISWDSINSRGAVYGNKAVEIKGLTYKVRLLRGIGEDVQPDPKNLLVNYQGIAFHNSEWNKLMCPISAEAHIGWEHPENVATPTPKTETSYTKNDLDIGMTESWCQEIVSSSSNRLRRGGPDASSVAASSSSNGYNIIGWRPVLELVE